MIYKTMKSYGSRTRLGRKVPGHVRDLAEAGAGGAVLTEAQIKEICEALQSRIHSVQNHFHSSN